MPWGSPGSFVILGFIPVRPGGGRGHSGSLGSFRRTLGVVGLIPVRCVRSDAPWCRRVDSGSLGLIRCVLRVVGFIRVRLFRPGAAWGSSG